MIERCTNPRKKAWHRYGGRGITVCDRWFTFENFLEDMGKRPDNLTLERQNNDGNYEPGNVIWATVKQQSNNKSTNVLIEFGGETKTMKQWSESTGINYQTLATRINELGWSAERALTKRARPIVHNRNET